MSAGTGRPRSVKLPPASDVPVELIDQLLDAIGWDEVARKRVRSVRINGTHVAIEVAPRPDVKLTVRHPIVWPEP